MTRPVRVQDDEWDTELHSNKETDPDSDSIENSNDRNSYDFKFKICLLGESNVGKTSLIHRYINNKFDDNSNLYRNNEQNDEINLPKTKTTIGLDFMTTVKIMRGHKIAIELWDTAGQERFNALTSNYLRSANAIILVYDLTDRASFEAIEKKWLQFVKNNIPTNVYGSADARLAIVANKLDLNDERVVPKKDGVRVATSNNCRFYEASAKNGRNVKELFRSVCDSICDYWCDLRGNPNFFPADVDTKHIRIKLNREKTERNRTSCVRC